jgi:DNA polymerase-1
MTQAVHPFCEVHGNMPPTKQGNPTLLLLDGHAMVYRAWHGIQRPMTIHRTGEDVRGVYGFTRMFFRALQTFEPTHVILTFDLPGPTFRHKLFSEYKAQRTEMPEGFHMQVPYVRRVMEALRVPVLSMEGYEADDVLGTLSALAEIQGINTLILTGDTDLYQLISPNVRVIRHLPKGELRIFDTSAISLQYDGLTPSQLIPMKALKGDTSDNIPGVPSIGEKTAVKLVGEFTTLQGIYGNLDKIPEKQRLALQNYREQAFKCLELVTIARGLPFTLDLDASRWGQYDHTEALEIFRELEFPSLVPLLNKMNPPTVGQESPIPATTSLAIQTNYQTVTDYAELDTLVDALTNARKFTFDTETTPLDPEDRSIDPMRCRLVGLSFSTGPGQAWYVPLGHAEGTQLEFEKALSRLGPFLKDSDHTRGAHNANYDMTVLASQGITIPTMAMDTMVAAHMLGWKAIGLKDLALDVLGIEMTPITELIGTGKHQTTMDKVPIDKVGPYASADADMTYRLWEVLEAELRPQEAWKLFEQVEMPLLPVLVSMQVAGIGMEASFLKEMGEELGKRLMEVEQEVYESVGGNKFNMNSPAQLGELLFDQLRLHEIEGVQMGRPRKTKTGKYSTDVAVLEGLRDAHPVVRLILEHRQLSKLKSTYVDALPMLVNLETGRVHTRYNQVGTITGRVSSNDPNLQNIPIRTELGRRIRQAFQPSFLGWKFMGVDYSQIELRVLAHLSQDPALMEAFYQDLDIHSATASEIFSVPLESVNSDQRRLAKVLNFGVIYGLSPFGIAQQTELTIEQGAQFIARYFSRYPGISQYIEETKRKTREQGYVQTYMGRRRHLYDINAGNPNQRQAAEREAINTPVQGTAAEVMKLAMISVHERMVQAKLRARMLLQVHDELIFETPPDEIEHLKALVLEAMPRAMELAVPLKVTIKVGHSWGELE